MLQESNVVFNVNENQKSVMLKVDQIKGYSNRYEVYLMINNEKLPIRKINGKRDTETFIKYMRASINESN